MRKLVLAAASLGVALSTVAAAQAEGGCGPAFHRTYYGACRPNFVPGPIVAGPAFGVFYPGRGYWYGNRYWGHRYWYGNGWRYR